MRGDAQIYGIVLDAFGMGAVIGALHISALRARFHVKISIRLCAMVMGAAVAVVAVSRSPVLTGSALLFTGTAWTASVPLFNVGVQLAAPRWGSQTARRQPIGRPCYGDCARQLGMGQHRERLRGRREPSSFRTPCCSPRRVHLASSRPACTARKSG